MEIIAELTSDEVLDTAYGWLCGRRRDYPADANVWSFRQGWALEKDRLKAALAAGRLTAASPWAGPFPPRASHSGACNMVAWLSNRRPLALNSRKTATKPRVNTSGYSVFAFLTNSIVAKTCP